MSPEALTAKRRRYRPGRAIRKALRQEKNLQARIARAEAEGDHRRARALRDLYLRHSRNAKISAAAEANRKGRRLSSREVLRVADRVDPFRGSAEPVRCYDKLKRSGGTRNIKVFGPENRTLQVMAARLLQTNSKISDHQYAVVPSRGRDAACRAVVEALNAGFDYVGQLDITDCYSSFKEEVIETSLAIPKRVTNRTIVSKRLSLAGKQEKIGLNHRARRGIPQGSAVSPIVTEILLASIADAVPQTVRAVLYVDDIVILGKTYRETASTLETLRCALLGHPAGPLKSRIEPVRSARAAFDFLGYDFKLFCNQVQVEPSEANFDRLHRGLYRILRRAAISGNAMHVKKVKKRAIDRMKSWTSAFALWPHHENFLNQATELVDDWQPGPRWASDLEKGLTRAILRWTRPKAHATTVNLYCNQYRLFQLALDTARDVCGATSDSAGVEMMSMTFVSDLTRFNSLQEKPEAVSAGLYLEMVELGLLGLERMKGPDAAKSVISHLLEAVGPQKATELVQEIIASRESSSAG